MGDKPRGFMLILGRMNHLIRVAQKEDMPIEYVSTPIGLLLEYHNLNRPFDAYSRAKMLVGMCMDNRKHLHIPENFSYILRAGGANMSYSEFKISYAIAVGGARAIALIGHTHCGMVKLVDRKEAFIRGLIDAAGWEEKQAEEHFLQYAPLFEIGNEIDFILSETARLRLRYPKIPVCPMIYRVEDNLLYLISESTKLS